MKTIQIKIAVFLYILSAVSSCKKDDSPSSAPSSGYSSLEEYYIKHAVKSQFFSINNTTQQIITGIKGTTVTFPAGSLVNSNGQTATGTIKVELKEIYTKSEMLFADKPSTTVTGPL